MRDAVVADINIEQPFRRGCDFQKGCFHQTIAKFTSTQIEGGQLSELVEALDIEHEVDPVERVL